MKYDELKTKTVSELYDLLANLKKELLGFRMQKSLEGLANTAQVRTVRRNIARIMMRLNAVKNGEV